MYIYTLSLYVYIYTACTQHHVLHKDIRQTNSPAYSFCVDIMSPHYHIIDMN